MRSHARGTVGALAVMCIAGALIAVPSIPPPTVAGAQTPLPSCGSNVDLTPDGRIAVFHTPTPFVPSDTNGLNDVYVQVMATSTFTLVSRSTSGAIGNGPSTCPTVSNDGRYIAFQSAATNLVAADTNGVTDVFLRDRTGGTTVRVSQKPAKQANGASVQPWVAGYGGVVVFTSAASNLVSGDTNGQPDVFWWKRSTGAIRMVSSTASGTVPNGPSGSPAPSDDGTKVAFVTDAPALGASGARNVIVVRNMTSGVRTKLRPPCEALSAGERCETADVEMNGSGTRVGANLDGGVGAAVLLDVATGAEVYRLVDGWGDEVAVSRDGKVLAWQGGAEDWIDLVAPAGVACFGDPNNDGFGMALDRNGSHLAMTLYTEGAVRLEPITYPYPFCDG